MNFQQFSQMAALASAAGPALIPLAQTIFTGVGLIVHSVEAVNPSAAGPKKFEAAMSEAEQLFGDLVKVAPDVFGSIINATVAIANAWGTFKHSTASSAPTA